MRLASAHKKPSTRRIIHSVWLCLSVLARDTCTSGSLKTEGCPQRTPIQLSHPPEGAVRTGGVEISVSFLTVTNDQARTRVCVNRSSQLQTPQPCSGQGSCDLVAYSPSTECWRSRLHISTPLQQLACMHASCGNTRGEKLHMGKKHFLLIVRFLLNCRA